MTLPGGTWTCRYCEIDALGHHDPKRRLSVGGGELYIAGDMKRVRELDGMTLTWEGNDILRLTR